MSALTTVYGEEILATCGGTDAQATSWAVERGYAVNRDGTAGNGHNYTVGRLTASGQEYAGREHRARQRQETAA